MIWNIPWLYTRRMCMVPQSAVFKDEPLLNGSSSGFTAQSRQLQESLWTCRLPSHAWYEEHTVWG